MTYGEGVKRAIKAFMEERGMTGQQVAERAGFRRQAVSSFINGDGGNLKTLLRVATALGTTPAPILTRAEEIINHAGGLSA